MGRRKKSRSYPWAGRLFVGAIAAALGVMAFFSTYLEARGFSFRAADEGARLINVFLDAAPGELRPSFFESKLARAARLGSCLQALGAAEAELPSRAVSGTQQLEETCLDIAEANTVRSPASSNDWLLAAILAARLGELERAKKYLSMSFRTGQSEMWIAERRAIFGYSLRDQLDAELRHQVDQDFLLLLRTTRGACMLAKRYAYDLPNRNHIVGLAEKTESDVQQRFAYLVEESLKGTNTAC